MREGDFVFVKTLKNLGGGKYAVSFAGGRFDVASERALQEGQAFRARISFAGGKVLLSPVKDGLQGAAETAQSPSALLQSLGLEDGSAAARVLQFLLQNGLRLDAKLMQKALRLAAKFKGREEDAAEAALVLEEKGIDSDGEALDKLMDLLDGGGEKRGQADGQNFSQGQNAGGGQTDDSEFLLELNGGAREADDSVGEADDSACEKCLRESSAKKGWTFFPYEFMGSGGVIRLYSDYERNAAEKMIVNYKSSGANIFFAVYFDKNGSPSAVRLSASEQGLLEILKAEKGAFEAAFGQGVKTEIVPSEKFSAFGVLDLPLAGVEAFA